MLCALHTFTPTGPVHSCTISIPFFGALAAISALGTNRTHCHLCPTRYFITVSSEACEGEVPCPRTQHRNKVLILRGEKHDISLKILHQAGFETARQAVTLEKHRALDIAPRPSLVHIENLDIYYVVNSRKKKAYIINDSSNYREPQ